MDNLEVLIPELSTLLVLLGTLAGFIVNFFKAKKAGKVANNKIGMLQYMENMISTIENVIDMSEAEKVAYIKENMIKYVDENKMTAEASSIEQMLSHIIKFFYQLQPIDTSKDVSITASDLDEIDFSNQQNNDTSFNDII